MFWNKGDTLDNRSDKIALQDMTINIRNWCGDQTFAVGDRKCSDFKIVDTYTMKSNDNVKLYIVKERYTLEWKDYLPGKENSMLALVAVVFEKNGSWDISSESFGFFRGKPVFANHSDEIMYMIKSFSLDPNAQQQFQPTAKSVTAIPGWIKNNASWWAEGQIDDNTFVSGIQHLVKVGIIKVS